jgi:hypothetical protein
MYGVNKIKLVVNSGVNCINGGINGGINMKNTDEKNIIYTAFYILGVLAALIYFASTYGN